MFVGLYAQADRIHSALHPYWFQDPGCVFSVGRGVSRRSDKPSRNISGSDMGTSQWAAAAAVKYRCTRWARTVVAARHRKQHDAFASTFQRRNRKTKLRLRNT